jgi:ribosomal protein S20
MPVTESAKKALRNAQAKEARNTEVEAQLKRVLKNAKAENLNEVVSFVDKAAKRHIIHPNKAARIKARLARIFTAGVTEMPKTVKKSAAKKGAAAKKAATKRAAAKKA